MALFQYSSKRFTFNTVSVRIRQLPYTVQGILNGLGYIPNNAQVDEAIETRHKHVGTSWAQTHGLAPGVLHCCLNHTCSQNIDLNWYYQLKTNYWDCFLLLLLLLLVLLLLLLVLLLLLLLLLSLLLFTDTYNFEAAIQAIVLHHMHHSGDENIIHSGQVAT